MLLVRSLASFKTKRANLSWSEMITSFGPLLLIAKSTVLSWFKFLCYQFMWQLTYSHFITKCLWHSPHFKPLKLLAGFIQDVPSFWGFKNNSKWKLLGRLFQMMSRLQKISEEYNVAVFITNQMTADPGASLSFQVSCWDAHWASDILCVAHFVKIFSGDNLVL